MCLQEICNAYANDMLDKKIKGVAKCFSMADNKEINGDAIAKKILEIAEGGEVGDEVGMSDIIVIGSHGAPPAPRREMPWNTLLFSLNTRCAGRALDYSP